MNIRSVLKYVLYGCCLVCFKRERRYVCLFTHPPLPILPLPPTASPPPTPPRSEFSILPIKKSRRCAVTQRNRSCTKTGQSKHGRRFDQSQLQTSWEMTGCEQSLRASVQVGYHSDHKPSRAETNLSPICQPDISKCY